MLQLKTKEEFAVTNPVYLPELVLYAGDTSRVYQNNAVQQSMQDIWDIVAPTGM